LEQQTEIKRHISPDNTYQQIKYIDIMSITLDFEIKAEVINFIPVLDINTLKLISEKVFPYEDIKLMWILS